MEPVGSDAHESGSPGPAGNARLAEEVAAVVAGADLEMLPRHFGEPLGSGTLRAKPADFSVREFTGVRPCGAGEHLYLRVRKTGQNTRWVARMLARYAGVPYKAVSYAGLKDRHAVTEQTFSLHLPGMVDPDWSGLGLDGVEILDARRHDRKLKQGQLSYNEFRIVLRDVDIPDVTALETRLGAIATLGVPNYFGAQRFGRDGGNLRLILDQPRLKKLPREPRSFALSALRSVLFNGYLAGRVADGTWLEALDGEALLSDRPRGVAERDLAVFRPQRLPAGVLWGRRWSGSGGEVRAREQAWFQQYPLLCAALEEAGCRMSRRVLRARVARLTHDVDDDGLTLAFCAGPGVFATVVLRELFTLRDAALETMA